MGEQKALIVRKVKNKQAGDLIVCGLQKPSCKQQLGFCNSYERFLFRFKKARYHSCAGKRRVCAIPIPDNSEFIIAVKPFPRGEGAPKGRMRNAGEAVRFSTMSVPVVMYNTGIGLCTEQNPTFPPVILIRPRYARPPSPWGKGLLMQRFTNTSNFDLSISHFE